MVGGAFSRDRDKSEPEQSRLKAPPTRNKINDEAALMILVVVILFPDISRFFVWKRRH